MAGDLDDRRFAFFDADADADAVVPVPALAIAPRFERRRIGGGGIEGLHRPVEHGFVHVLVGGGSEPGRHRSGRPPEPDGQLRPSIRVARFRGRNRCDLLAARTQIHRVSDASDRQRRIDIRQAGQCDRRHAFAAHRLNEAIRDHPVRRLEHRFGLRRGECPLGRRRLRSSAGASARHRGEDDEQNHR